MKLTLQYEERPFTSIVLISIDGEERGYIRVKDKEEFKELQTKLLMK